mgnify:CR=1 FL=1
MADYNNRGGTRFDGNRFKKPSFGKKSWGGDRGGDRPVTLHKATCAKCNAACEVPFRPIAGKPVFCKDCFNRAGGREGGERGGDRFPKRDFSAHSAPRPRFESGAENGAAGGAVLKQLEAVNGKLERLIQAVEMLASKKTFETKKESGEASAAPKKGVKKKTAKK